MKNKQRFTVDVRSSDPDFAGSVSFHLPNNYERILIRTREAMLNDGKPLETMLEVTTNRNVVTEFFFTRGMATLETLIDTAPKGYYRDEKGVPVLDLSDVPAHQIFSLWSRVDAERENRFRKDDPDQSKPERSETPSDVDGSQSPQS